MRRIGGGNDEYTNQLPAEWKATDAVLIVCAGATEFGTPVDPDVHAGFAPLITP